MGVCIGTIDVKAWTQGKIKNCRNKRKKKKKGQQRGRSWCEPEFRNLTQAKTICIILYIVYGRNRTDITELPTLSFKTRFAPIVDRATNFLDLDKPMVSWDKHFVVHLDGI